MMTRFGTTSSAGLSLATALLTIGISLPAIGQTKVNPPPPPVKVLSGDLFVTGTRDHMETRTLVLRSNTALRNFRFSSTDLAQKDGTQIFAAAQIQPETTNQPDVPAGETLSIPVRFDLSKAASSGDFRGNLVIQHEEGELLVPVTVQVKDGGLLPLLLLLSGVGGAILLAKYQRDSVDLPDIAVEVGRLRSQLQAEPEIPTAFKAQIAADLSDAEAALAWPHWDKADRAITQAQTTWERWRSAKLDWQQLFQYADTELAAALGAVIPTDTPYGSGLKQQLERLLASIAQYDSCLKWAEQLDGLKQQFERYFQVQNQIAQLVGLRDRLEHPPIAGGITAIDFDNTLNNLSPDDQVGISALETALTTTLEHLRTQLISDESTLTPELPIVQARKLLSPVKLIPPPAKVPIVGGNASPLNYATDRWKLQSYQWAGRAIGLGLLCGVGYHQLGSAFM
jgi:hypothetical protein